MNRKSVRIYGSVYERGLPPLHASGLCGHRAEVGGDGPLSLEHSCNRLPLSCTRGIRGALPVLRRLWGGRPRSPALRIKSCFLPGSTFELQSSCWGFRAALRAQRWPRLRALCLRVFATSRSSACRTYQGWSLAPKGAVHSQSGAIVHPWGTSATCGDSFGHRN